MIWLLRIDQDWFGESKRAARSSDLVDLFVGMNARVKPICLQRRNWTKCDTQILELRTDRFVVVRHGAAPTIGGEAKQKRRNPAMIPQGSARQRLGPIGRHALTSTLPGSVSHLAGDRCSE
jgi:hypothetical protein